MGRGQWRVQFRAGTDPGSRRERTRSVSATPGTRSPATPARRPLEIGPFALCLRVTPATRWLSVRLSARGLVILFTSLLPSGRTSPSAAPIPDAPLVEVPLNADASTLCRAAARTAPPDARVARGSSSRSRPGSPRVRHPDGIAVVRHDGRRGHGRKGDVGRGERVADDPPAVGDATRHLVEVGTDDPRRNREERPGRPADLQVGFKS